MKDIAIIGYSGIFPGADSIAKFSKHLEEGKTSINNISEKRIHDTAISKDASYFKAGYLEDITHFDHRFFDISLGEAEEITPHQRLLLQEAYKTFEHGNYRPQDLKGSDTSVYVGDTATDYYLLAKEISPSLITGNMKALNASRISRFFDLRGAALNIDTTCSSTLAAISFACKDLASDETDMALVCGVNVSVFPPRSDSDIVMGIESSSGKCAPFSANADGTLPGEAVACVLLKRLDKAIADRDIIHGVIKGIALNQDGASSSSITAPSSEAQTLVIKKALDNAGIQPGEVSFIEAHGTGTKLGDPIEIEGIANVFSSHLDQEERIYISTVKSNIGHTDSAAGISGIIKTLLSFKNNMLYPSVNAAPLNEYIDFDAAKVRVLTSPISWDTLKRTDKKIAGISSFGLMGTNAHAILEHYEYPVKKDAGPGAGEENEYLYCFSAKSKNSLQHYINVFSDYLPGTKASMETLSYTLNTSREIYNYRYVVSAKDPETLLSKLKKYDENRVFESKAGSPVILVFDDLFSIDRDALIKALEAFPALDIPIEECTSPARTSILLQYYAYQLLTASGVVIKDMIGQGTGKIVIKILKKELTIEEALSMADAYDHEITPETVLEQKANKLIGNYNESVQFISMGYCGTLGNVFKKLSDTGICMHNNFGYSAQDALNESLQTLFKLHTSADPRELYKGIQEQKTILPAYVFDKIRCWLRTPDDPYLGNHLFDGIMVASTEDTDTALNLEGLTTVQQLQKLWEMILKTTINAEDDFFEFGGHSLNGQQLINRINEVFATDFDMDTLFEYGTPALMEAHINSVKTSTDKNPAEIIQKTEEKPEYEVSFAQKRLWLSSKLSNNTTSLNVSESIMIEGALDCDKLIQAFHMLLDRHESLRTIFILDKEGLKQKILPVEECGFHVTIEEQENLTEEQLKEYVLRYHENPFNLDKGLLIRSNILRTAKDKHIVSLSLHHLICDGWSVGIIQKELFHIYDALHNNKEVQLPELSIHYKDYTAWLLEKVNTPEFREAEAYWINKFSPAPAPVTLNHQNPRPPLKTYNGAITTFFIPEELSAELKTFIQKKGITLTMALGAILNVFLYKLSGKTDLVLGLPIAERNHKQLENQIGLFLNMIAYRMQWDTKISFSALAEQSAVTLKEAYKNKLYPFELLVEKLQLNTEPGRFPLADVVLSVQNFMDLDILKHVNEAMPMDLKVKSFEIEDYSAAQFDLAYRFVEQDKTLYYEIEYNTDLFSEKTIKLYHEFLVAVLRQCLDAPDQPMTSITLFSENDIQKQLNTLADGGKKVPVENSITDYLRPVFKTNYHRTAVVYEDQSLTYEALDKMSNQLANYILDHYDVKKNDTVILSAETSAYLIVSILGILKAGLVYVPVDHKIPQQRQDYIKQDVGAKFVIDDIWLKTFNGVKDSIASTPPTVKISGDQLAYIIYTSGSTGKPKGVMIPHSNLLELMLNCNDAHFDFTADDVWTLYHNYSFDFSIWEIFGPLFFGGKLVLPPKDKVIDFKSYINLIQQYGVTVLNFTPKVFAEFENVRRLNELTCPSVRYVIFGGDALLPSILRKWHIEHPKCKIINMYGITEITVHGTIKEITDENINRSGAISNIGRPLQGLRFYLFDEKGRLLPEGETGEIYVSGNQLASGYFNRKTITEERFIEETHYGLGRLYRSGDLARWLPNGDLEYLGRTDHQVKINGFRIELNEIKYVLLGVKEIEEAHVTVQNVANTTHLLAYYQSKTKLEEQKIKEALKEQLPYYMIPNFFFHVEKFELNSNGKINTSDLPDINMAMGTKETTASVSVEGISAKIQNLFFEVLGYEGVGTDMNFFDLGGNSLQLVRLHSAIDAIWPQAILISDLFELNTINAISNYLKKHLETGEVVKDQKEDDQQTEVEFFEI